MLRRRSLGAVVWMALSLAAGLRTAAAQQTGTQDAAGTPADPVPSAPSAEGKPAEAADKFKIQEQIDVTSRASDLVDHLLPGRSGPR
jgi:hypothetical protein